MAISGVYIWQFKIEGDSSFRLYLKMLLKKHRVDIERNKIKILELKLLNYYGLSDLYTYILSKHNVTVNKAKRKKESVDSRSIRYLLSLLVEGDKTIFISDKVVSMLKSISVAKIRMRKECNA